MVDSEKRGEDGNTKIWIYQERKEYFSQLFKGYHLVKKWKIADKSFK